MNVLDSYLCGKLRNYRAFGVDRNVQSYEEDEACAFIAVVMLIRQAINTKIFYCRQEIGDRPFTSAREQRTKNTKRTQEIIPESEGL